MTSRGSSGRTMFDTASPETAPSSMRAATSPIRVTGMSTVVRGGAVCAASESSSLTMIEMSPGTLRPAVLEDLDRADAGHEARDVDRCRQIAAPIDREARAPRRRRRLRCSRSRRSTPPVSGSLCFASWHPGSQPVGAGRCRDWPGRRCARSGDGRGRGNARRQLPSRAHRSSLPSRRRRWSGD